MAVHKITGIQVQQKNNQRVNIFLDGHYAFGLRRIVAAWLVVGQEITDEKIAELRYEDTIEEAFQTAMRQLEHRPRSETEIQKKLLEKEYPDEVRNHVVLRLKQTGLLNDRQFSKTWIENRNEFRPRSKKALAYELRLKGLDSELIDEALECVNDELLAYEAASRYSRRLSQLQWPEFRLKLINFLSRKGFDYETSKNVVSQVWSDRQNSNLDEAPIEKVIED
jgi:regulatory protein